MKLKNLNDILAILLINTVFKFYHKLPKKIINKRQLFFIVGIGRSGTTFLANILDTASKTPVYHEAKEDYIALVDAYWDRANAERYILGYREKLIAARIILKNCEIYGEVNSLLRYHVDILEELWNPTIFHLFRDGRSVVRSMMNRKAFTPQDINHTGRIFPKKNDKLADRWTFMTRFEKVCWYWAETNNYLLHRELLLIRFEDILNSYDAFIEQITIPLQMTFSYETWKKEIKKPRNIAKTNGFPEWKEWSAEQRRQFIDICGSTMEILGYSI